MCWCFIHTPLCTTLPSFAKTVPLQKEISAYKAFGKDHWVAFVVLCSYGMVHTMIRKYELLSSSYGRVANFQPKNVLISVGSRRKSIRALLSRAETKPQQYPRCQPQCWYPRALTWIQNIWKHARSVRHFWVTCATRSGMLKGHWTTYLKHNMNTTKRIFLYKMRARIPARTTINWIWRK